MPGTRAAAGLLLLLLAPACVSTAQDDLEATLERVRRATFLVEGGRCAGAVVADGTVGLTAAHCILPGATRVRVQLSEGPSLQGRLLVLERARDLALIELPRAQARRVRPLPLARHAPTPGAPLLYVGRPDRGGEPQRPVLLRLGRCPSLPKVPDALFTTVLGRPGDSGAPLLDGSLRVVGIVHGGAGCSIAAPAWEVGGILARTRTAGDAPRRSRGLPRRAR